MAGKSGKSGRRTLYDERDALNLLNAAWPMSRRRKAIRAMADEAEAGNVKAATLLMNYAYGKPKERIEVTNPAEAAKDALRAILSETGLSEERARQIVAARFGIPEQELVSDEVM